MTHPALNAAALLADATHPGHRPVWHRWAFTLSVLAAAALQGCASLGNGSPAATTDSTMAATTAPTPAAPAEPPAAPTPAPAMAAATAPVTVPPAAPVTVAAATAAPAPPQTAVTQDAPTPPVITVDPLQPTVRLDLDDREANTDLWARVRHGFAVPDQDNDLVRKWEQWYGSRPDYVQRMTERGGRYLFHIVEEVNKRGLPTELALLPFIESAFNPQAKSVAKASGMWQFMSATGRDFDLRQNIFRDDRRDVLASTRAALDYLQTLHGMFGDWQLALAAYNWGQGSVQKAIKRNQAAGLPTDYASLRMPDETRNYYPKLQAVKNIVLKPEQFSLTLAELRNHPYFVSVGISRDIDIDIAARLAKLPLEEFKQLNPQMNKPVILASVTPQVLLPYDNANAFAKALSSQRNLATWTAWVAPRTMKSADVAREVGMSEERLREVNSIPPKMLVKAGSTLLVPRDPRRDQDVQEEVADNAMLALAPDLPPFKRVTFKAGKRGDSVAAVARRYRVSASSVAQWNKTTVGGQFAKGQLVVLMLPQKARQPAAAAPASRTADAAGREGKAGKAAKAVAGAGTRAQAAAIDRAPAGARQRAAVVKATAARTAGNRQVASAAGRPAATAARGGGNAAAKRPAKPARVRVAQD